MFIVYVPINKGLERIRNDGLFILRQYSPRPFDVRYVKGQDIPTLVSAGKVTGTLGITGSDFWQEYRLGGNFGVEKLEDIIKSDGAFVFNKPTLCLLAPKEWNVTDDPDLHDKMIAIPRKYQRLVQSRLQGSSPRYITLSGQVEVTAAKLGIFGVDVVATGKTIEEAGMQIVRPLYSADGVILRKAWEPRRVLTEVRS